MAECKSRKTSRIELMLVLNDEEAKRLRTMLQNPVYGQSAPEEHLMETNLRRTIFDALVEVT